MKARVLGASAILLAGMAGISALSFPRTENVPAQVAARPAAAVIAQPQSVGEPTGEQIARAVKRFKLARLGTQQLEDAIKALVRKRDEVSVGTLLALSEAHLHEDLVLEVLGQLRSSPAKAQAAAHLEKKFTTAPAPLLCKAIKSYGALMGEASVCTMQGLIRANWARSDGWGEQICSTAVAALQAVRTPAARAALFAELQRVDEPAWLPDYGSSVVKALATDKTADTHEALTRYAEGLKRRMPSADDPNGRSYIEQKVAEAYGAAAGAAGAAPIVAEVRP